MWQCQGDFGHLLIWESKNYSTLYDVVVGTLEQREQYDLEPKTIKCTWYMLECYPVLAWVVCCPGIAYSGRQHALLILIYGGRIHNMADLSVMSMLASTDLQT